MAKALLFFCCSIVFHAKVKKFLCARLFMIEKIMLKSQAMRSFSNCQSLKIPINFSLRREKLLRWKIFLDTKYLSTGNLTGFASIHVITWAIRLENISAFSLKPKFSFLVVVLNLNSYNLIQVENITSSAGFAAAVTSPNEICITRRESYTSKTKLCLHLEDESFTICFCFMHFVCRRIRCLQRGENLWQFSTHRTAKKTGATRFLMIARGSSLKAFLFYCA